MKNLIEKIFLLGTEKEVTKKLNKDENLVVFNLNNNAKLCYLVDIFSLNGIKKRLHGGKVGVLAIGEDKQNRVDLNQVKSININDNPFVDFL